MSDTYTPQDGDIVVAYALEGLAGLDGNFHEDEVEAVHEDHVHFKCLDGTDDRFVVTLEQFVAEYKLVRRP